MLKLSFKEKVWKQREQAILSSAGDLLRNYGYDAMSMDELAEAVGVAKPTLYQHFAGKEELVAQILISAMGLLEEHLQTSREGNTRDQLLEVVRLLLEARHSPHSPMAMIDHDLMHRLIRSNPAIAEKKHHINVLLYAIINEGKARGEIAQDMPTEMIAGSIFCSVNVFKATYPDATPEYWEEHLDERIDQYTKGFERLLKPG